MHSFGAVPLRGQVRVLSRETLSRQLGEAASAHLGATIKVQGGKVQVPLVFYSSRKELGKSAEQLDFLRQSLPPTLVSNEFCNECGNEHSDEYRPVLGVLH